MNRNDEYHALLLKLETTPEALETTVERALKREKASRARRWFYRPAISLAACFTTFVLLVNAFPTFAHACGNVPILRDLAKAVCWSPSLSAAVENEYVQPIGKSQTVNGITATIEYVIVDQKQVNIFFTLDGDYENLSAEIPEFMPEQVCGISNGNFRQKPGTLLDFTLDYIEEDVPDHFTMTFGVTTYVEAENMEERFVPVENAYDDMLEPIEREEPDILAEFTFNLEFDPTYTVSGEIIPVNTSFEMNGQTMTVTEVEVYPTHTRVEIEGAAENMAWLNSVEFYLENEDGQKFEPISNGVSATGDPNSPAMLSFHLESPYFADSDHLTLHITNATWLDKDQERIHIDLARETMDEALDGVELLSADQRDNGWILTFKVKRIKENHSFSVFRGMFYDAEGNEYYNYSGARNVSDEEGYFEEIFPLPDYDQDEVWLMPQFTHMTKFDPIITVPIK